MDQMNNLQDLAKFIKDVDGNPCVNIILQPNDSDTALYGEMKNEPLGVDMDLRLYMDSVSTVKLEKMLNGMGVNDLGSYADDLKAHGGKKMYDRYIPKGDGQTWILPKNDNNGDVNND